jgi:YfiH family protein
VSNGEVLTSRRLADGRTAVVALSDRRVGDLRIDLDPGLLDERRRGLSPHPWTWLRQEHGAEVVTVGAPGAGAGSRADGAVTSVSGATLAVHTADCAPVALIAEAGVVGVAHAGWKGLTTGVIWATVEAMRASGADRIAAVVGPCIHRECYDFGEADLDAVSERVGATVRAESRTGGPALDLPAGVVAALARAGVTQVSVDDRCTGCDPDRFSHRMGQDRGRQALVAWIDP